MRTTMTRKTMRRRKKQSKMKVGRSKWMTRKTMRRRTTSCHKMMMV